MATPVAAAPARGPGLFDTWGDRELLSLGVPEELIPQVRAVKSEDGLDTLLLAPSTFVISGTFPVSPSCSSDPSAHLRFTRATRGCHSVRDSLSLTFAKTASGRT
jgi:hypothetical protein